MNISYEIIKSMNIVSHNKIVDILKWVDDLNNSTNVRITKCDIDSQDFWFINDLGELTNKNNSFFKIVGINYISDSECISQPMIVQDEIGYLGFIVSIIDGHLQFLIQAKIEPGNINVIQLSPTIQATKSNFMQKHGGKLPGYLDEFKNVNNKNVIYDQIQSEQNSRFIGKRNRNMVIFLESIEIINGNFKWVSLGELKTLMNIDNLVNMDTRTIIGSFLACLEIDCKRKKSGNPWLESLYCVEFYKIKDIFHSINNIKMYSCDNVRKVHLNHINWRITKSGIFSKKPSNYNVEYFDIAIEGREVKQWCQPLLTSCGKSLFGLICRKQSDKMLFLVKLLSEIGSFDKVELSPTIILDAIDKIDKNNPIEVLFDYNYKNNISVLYDVVLSEEGGRFYHEENSNVIIEVDDSFPKTLPNNYFWVTLGTLNELLKINNLLNIQLRNLLSLIVIGGS